MATESKLNLARDANVRVRTQIDGLREDRLTFRRLFAGLSGELQAAQEQVDGLRRTRDEAYATRDHAQQEMRELAKAFELDKLERVREWHILSQVGGGEVGGSPRKHGTPRSPPPSGRPS